MQKLKFVWGSIFCLLGSMSFIGSIVLLGAMSTIQDLWLQWIGTGVGTFNTAQAASQLYEDAKGSVFLECGIAVVFMVLGSLLVYSSDDQLDHLPTYKR